MEMVAENLHAATSGSPDEDDAKCAFLPATSGPDADGEQSPVAVVSGTSVAPDPDFTTDPLRRPADQTPEQAAKAMRLEAKKIRFVVEEDTDAEDDNSDVEHCGLTPHKSRGSDHSGNKYSSGRSAKSDGSPRCICLLYVWTAVLCVGCLTTLVVVILLLVEPYRKGAQFVQARCVPVRIDIPPRLVHCSCGKACRSSFPCVVIHVQYEDRAEHTHTAALKDNESYLNRECSFYPVCESSRAANTVAVEEFQGNYGDTSSDTEFDCFYDPNDPELVIRRRRFQLYHVVHAVLWTSLLFILSVVLMLFVVRRRNCAFMSS